jgi:hypothetical protein
LLYWYKSTNTAASLLYWCKSTNTDANYVSKLSAYHSQVRRVSICTFVPELSDTALSLLALLVQNLVIYMYITSSAPITKVRRVSICTFVPVKEVN